MFSYEDRLRAVQLYIKLGKRIGLTIRQLGYPTKNALLSWHREYEKCLDLPAGYVRQPRYSQVYKELAVGHYVGHGRCIASTIRALGYPSRSLLSEWLQDLNPQEHTRVVGRSRELAPAAKQSAVIALCMRPASAQVVAEELGVSRGSLYKWKNQLLGHEASAPMKRQQDAPASPDRSELEQQLETLQRDIRRLQLEKDLLKKANELLKKELGIDRQSLTNREKTQLVDALRPIYTLTEHVVAACSKPGVSSASVAMANGINANLVRRWVKDAEGEQQDAGAVEATNRVKRPVTKFVSLPLPSPAPVNDIRVELQRGATKIVVTWPATAASECAAWMRELLR